jgi:hypothetical protein
MKVEKLQKKVLLVYLQELFYYEVLKKFEHTDQYILIHGLMYDMQVDMQHDDTKVVVLDEVIQINDMQMHMQIEVVLV